MKLKLSYHVNYYIGGEKAVLDKLQVKQIKMLMFLINGLLYCLCCCTYFVKFAIVVKFLSLLMIDIRLGWKVGWQGSIGGCHLASCVMPRRLAAPRVSCQNSPAPQARWSCEHSDDALYQVACIHHANTPALLIPFETAEERVVAAPKSELDEVAAAEQEEVEGQQLEEECSSP